MNIKNIFEDVYFTKNSFHIPLILLQRRFFGPRYIGDDFFVGPRRIGDDFLFRAYRSLGAKQEGLTIVPFLNK